MAREKTPSAEQINEIRRMVAEKMPQSEIAQRVGVDTRTITTYAPRYRPRTGSLRARVLDAFQKTSEFATVGDIMIAIREPNENIDLHSLTHIIRALRQQGFLSFKEDKTGGRNGAYSRGSGSRTTIPYAITLAKHPQANPKNENSERAGSGTLDISGGPTPQQRHWAHQVNDIGYDSSCPICIEESKHEVLDAPVEPKILDAPVESKVMGAPVQPASEFPLTGRLIHKRNRLEAAAKLLEEAGAEDIAIVTMERLGTPLTALEQEAVALWQRCFGDQE